MRKEIIFHIIFFVTLANLVSCSYLLYTETNNQTINNNNSIVNDDNVNNYFFYGQWTLKTINISDYEKLSFPIYGMNSTLKLTENGHYSGIAICNTFYGEYLMERNYIKFSHNSMTRVNCYNKTEELIIMTLGRIDNYSVYDKKLFLKRNTETLMIYELN